MVKDVSKYAPKRYRLWLLTEPYLGHQPRLSAAYRDGYLQDVITWLYPGCNDVKNMDNIVSAGGPIDKGFELILSEFDEVREELSQVREELNQRVDSLDEKLDTILSHITGIDKSNNE